ncbi:MAG: prephenate dehydrogenase [Clostridia bacterium]|nr:prephenate dehydrogenase [Clostridia bacterium]
MKIAIIGMGLIGGSLGRAILKNTDNEVLGYDLDESVLLKADLLSAHTRALDMESDLPAVDMVILALCPRAAIASMRKLAPHLKDGAIVMDICGNKRIVVDEMASLEAKYPNLFFIGTHPMAGREFSGISHSSATLFEKAYVVLTPVSQDISKLSAVKKLFLAIGAQDVEICSAEKHDEMIAYTSQLAHIVSSSYVKNGHSNEHAGFSAGSFRDLTRVAKLNPDMWTELFLENRDNLVGDIDEIIKHLIEYRDAIASGDEEGLKVLLADGVRQKEAAENARKERLKD